MPEKSIKTGGGPAVEGNVNIEDGDFIGRDKIKQNVISGSVIVTIVALIITCIVSLNSNKGEIRAEKSEPTPNTVKVVEHQATPTITPNSASTTQNTVGGKIVGSTVYQAGQLNQTTKTTVAEQNVVSPLVVGVSDGNAPSSSNGSTQNIVKGDVISSTLYQANEIIQTNEEIVHSNTLSVQQKMIREAGQALQEALEDDKQTMTAIVKFQDVITKSISMDPTNEEKVRLLANDALRQASKQLVRIGEHWASIDNYTKAVIYFSNANALHPPVDALLYVYVSPGEFISNPTDNSSYGGVVKGDQVTASTPGFWIMRTEVTNAEYKECVDVGRCKPPESTITSEWTNEGLGKRPVNIMFPDLINDYLSWVGGRLPTDAEWEKACRGTDGRTYPWGNEEPKAEYANYMNGVLTDVGTYPKGVSPYGLYDMAGNAWEWVAREGDPRPPLRGGSTNEDIETLHCSSKMTPAAALNFFSFRVVIPDPKDQ